MKIIAATLFLAATAVPSFAQNADVSQTAPSRTPLLTDSDVRAVSPALDRYIREAIFGDLWQRPQLSPRDRSVVTLAVLISRYQTVELPFHLRRALDNGVKPREISEIITHLAFYSGLGNATSVILLAKEASQGDVLSSPSSKRKSRASLSQSRDPSP